MTPVDSEEEDLTRKQRREQARAQRKALEQAELASAARRTRLRQLGIVVAIVVVAIVVILIAAGGGGSKKAVNPESSAGKKASAEVTSLLGGIPQSGNTLGNPSAPVTLQYFGDLQCPICREFTLGALPSIIQTWVRPGKLKIEYLSLETATHEPEVFKTQQTAALAAGKQAKMWNFLELFYRQQGEENSGYVTEGFLQSLAAQSGVDLTRWTSARNDSALASQLASEAQAASSAGLNGTPSFLIGKGGGGLHRLEYSSLTDPGSFNEGIEKELKS